MGQALAFLSDLDGDGMNEIAVASLKIMMKQEAILQDGFIFSTGTVFQIDPINAAYAVVEAPEAIMSDIRDQ